MKASFVIVNYNRRDELLTTLQKTKELITSDSAAYEMIVVDNASLDGSAAAIREKFPDVVVVENSANTGAPAWNLGFAIAKGDYFIILDDDSHIEFGLEEALEYMENNKDTGVLALNITNGPYKTKDWKWRGNQELIGFFGCGAILRKETYEKVGGYADWIFLYVNEFEYGLRCLNKGYKIRYFENSSVNHRASAKNRSNKRLRVQAAKNEMGIVYTHFTTNKLKYLFRMWVNNMKIVKYGKFRQAYYDTLGALEFLKIRKTLKPTPVSKEAQDYFVKAYHNTHPIF
jgi:GT2 family glycosyltransferase